MKYILLLSLFKITSPEKMERKERRGVSVEDEECILALDFLFLDL
jgi:hypothetical protein